MTDSQKLDLLLEKVISIDNHVILLDNRIASLEDRVASLENRMESLENRVASLESRMESLESRVESLESDMESLKREVTNTRLIIENETNHNIKIVAEGHLDLSRKLDEAIEFSNEITAKLEKHEIYINRHERMLSAM